MAIKERWLVDESGKRIAVVLDIEEYNKLLEELEEQDDVRDFDKAMANPEQAIPLDQAMSEIGQKRHHE